jgi:hypothetical protein
MDTARESASRTSRRTFVKGAAVGAATIATGRLLSQAEPRARSRRHPPRNLAITIG